LCVFVFKYDECVIKIAHENNEFLRIQIVLDLIQAAGFSGCNDARHIELNLESVRKYIFDNESTIKSIWPRSQLNNSKDNHALISYVNNKIKDFKFHATQERKNRAPMF
jgi:uncharacterized UBP type Zn finger protein